MPTIEEVINKLKESDEEAAGVVSSPAHNGSREVLAGSPPEY